MVLAQFSDLPINKKGIMLCIGLKINPSMEQIPYDDITERKTQNKPMAPKSGCKENNETQLFRIKYNNETQRKNY